ncbi:predicted protein [Sclerotinia sclerotiorum 1980 UF-70]|uniref:Uncharacterized protein n=1 Tax=Sclerotinia sclerotiorum (strain ATCC 18683 / 1980 / Ss-1) TaxID=665079 RepID=A7E4P7_SCLS1|nr:predicted protein [Sclerotinia sclerotiorum 1980 UF-70]EDN90869.1 predicted protein [Sclerotinia sclerotiorum 1980 UF-70]
MRCLFRVFSVVAETIYPTVLALLMAYKSLTVLNSNNTVFL